jgi:hypothetical protein|tara:strand:+ start:43 stop:183 length:141 start_codon:yes stop_codon:yes gene_type:complete
VNTGTFWVDGEEAHNLKFMVVATTVLMRFGGTWRSASIGSQQALLN